MTGLDTQCQLCSGRCSHPQLKGDGVILGLEIQKCVMILLNGSEDSPTLQPPCIWKETWLLMSTVMEQVLPNSRRFPQALPETPLPDLSQVRSLNLSLSVGVTPLRLSLEKLAEAESQKARPKVKAR